MGNREWGIGNGESGMGNGGQGTAGTREGARRERPASGIDGRRGRGAAGSSGELSALSYQLLAGEWRWGLVFCLVVAGVGGGKSRGAPLADVARLWPSGPWRSVGFGLPLRVAFLKGLKTSGRPVWCGV
jgi:hypothetical protein